MKPETVPELIWKTEIICDGNDILHSVNIENVGRITVLDRLTGYSGYIRDIETGFKDLDGKFWLASGNKDIRNYPNFTIEQAVNWIKNNANNCIGE